MRNLFLNVGVPAAIATYGYDIDVEKFIVVSYARLRASSDEDCEGSQQS